MKINKSFTQGDTGLFVQISMEDNARREKHFLYGKPVWKYAYVS